MPDDGEADRNLEHLINGSPAIFINQSHKHGTAIQVIS